MILGYKVTLTNDEYTNAYKVINRDQYIVIKIDGTKEIIDSEPSNLKFKTRKGEEDYLLNISRYKPLTEYFEYLTTVITKPVMEFINTANSLYGERFIPISNVHPFIEYPGEKPASWLFHFGVYDSVDQLFYLCPIIISDYKARVEPNYIPTELNFLVINSLYNKFIYKK